MSITVTPLSDAIGAAITDVDLSEEVDAETVAAIKQAWLDNIINMRQSLLEMSPQKTL